MQNLRMGKENLAAFVCWSGGKESALSFYRARIAGVKILYLLNMTEKEGKYSHSHRLLCDTLKIQAKSLGVFLAKANASWESYQERFKKKVLDLKMKGVNAGVFGDIDLQQHRDWVQRVCREVEIQPLLPLWREHKERVLEGFIHAGFKAKLISIRADLLDESWLGRQIDKKFVKELKSLGNIDLCGEKGEYHSFVFDGPIFKKRIEFSTGKKVVKDNYCFLEINVI